eukprot:CAMPEP_0197043068 /NCGR_PEP_ID=MMETSP1384-20130603/19354_1 /TAXON_ID=29189 /ORGANISM="Ammonia sp." /LENGTH=289 /DNA_ID=CAMNT_0042474299 /DNA_START=415 /DNA_END=1284 /DNA_ORIENTATION=-
MLSHSREMHNLMKNKHTSMESLAVKYIDMLGWLLKYLHQNVSTADMEEDDASSTHSSFAIAACPYPALQKLGEMHRAKGIKLEHFGAMLQALHETFSYYFEKKYSIQVKYAIDVIFTMAAEIMTGTECKDLKAMCYLKDVAKQCAYDECKQQQVHDVDFVESLEKCLASTMGRAYFYNYLQSAYCHEFCIYLTLITKFYGQTSDIQRFVVAREIARSCLKRHGPFALNLSHECRVSTLETIKTLEASFRAKKQVLVPLDLFKSVEVEMRRLIIKQHWASFKEQVRNILV